MPKKNQKLRVIPLGGINEIGENMTVLEYGNDMIIVDCGLGFPDEDMPGIDLVIPDISYVEANKEKLRGIVLTHGHEDHIGAVPYVLRSINPPVYGTKLTLGIIQNKLKELKPPNEPNFKCVQAGEIVRLGAFNVEFIRVNHSIADACALAIHTPVGTVIHTGDFKLDTSPVEGEMMNLTRLGELGNKGVLLLMCESTNAERPGFTMSERKVGESMESIFRDHADKRVIIATFSSNVHRVQQIIDISARHGRKVAVTGRSMISVLGAATELGYMNMPERTLIDISEIKKYPPEKLTLITTGSQGEPMSALHRMAYSDHAQVKLGPQDVVILSASAIPGNEKLVSRVINEMLKSGVKVLHNDVADVHVSGTREAKQLRSEMRIQADRITMEIEERQNDVKTLTAQLQIQAGLIEAKVSKTGGNASTFGWALTDSDWTIKANSIDILKATKNGLEVYGKITATSGKIGGFNILSNYLSYNNQAWGGTNTTGIYIGISGIQLGKNFKVDSAGNLTAASGTFTGSVNAGNIRYGGSYGTFNGGGISSGTITGNRLVGGTITTAYTSSGINAALADGTWAANLFSGVKDYNASIKIGTVSCVDLYQGGYGFSTKSVTIKDYYGDNVTIRYWGW